MKKLIMLVTILTLLFIGVSVSAEMSQEKQEAIVNEVILTCIEKMDIENNPMTEENMKACGAQQIPAAMYTAKYIVQIRQLPEGKTKEILKGLVASCLQENRLPSGKIDQYEAAKCIKLKTEVLDYMIKQKLKES